MVIVTVLLGGGSGCTVQQTVSTHRLIQHQAMVDFAGLKPTEVVEAVKAHVAPPQKWDQLVPKKTSMYTDQQWRSPSRQTGVGVAYVRLPLPLPAKALMWMAKREYSKQAADGELLAEWTDALGRPWFEAQTSNYRIRGYAVTKGFEAWFIYSGYKREQPPSAAELGIASRAMETIVPTPFAADVPQKPMATTDAAGD